jgi:replicative DNA helicase
MNIKRIANSEAEANILGAVLVNNNKILTADDMLESRDFYDIKNRTIYSAMLMLYKDGKKIDVTTLSEVLGEKLKDITITYISKLVEIAPIGSIKDYCDIVKEKSRMRLFNQIVQNALIEIENSDKNVDLITEKLEKNLVSPEVFGQQKSKIITDDELMSNTLDAIEKNYERGGAILGIKTGIETLDKALNGLQQKKLYVIAGRPGMAKSAFALNLAQNISKDKHVLYYSLEMSADELGIRRLAMKSYINTLKLEKGKMSDSEWSKIANISGLISQGHCYTDCTPRRNINTIRLQCKKLKMQNKLDVLIIDYIGIMALKNMGDSRQEQISNACIELKNMAKEFNMPIIALAQINRGPESRNDKRPTLADLKESGGIEENADVVMLLYRDEYYHKNCKEKNVIEVNIAKQRDGRTGTIKLTWQPKYQLVADKALYVEDGSYDPNTFKHKEA